MSRARLLIGGGEKMFFGVTLPIDNLSYPC